MTRYHGSMVARLFPKQFNLHHFVQLGCAAACRESFRVLTFITCFMTQPAGRCTYCQSNARYSWNIFQKISPYNPKRNPVIVTKVRIRTGYFATHFNLAPLTIMSSMSSASVIFGTRKHSANRFRRGSVSEQYTRTIWAFSEAICTTHSEFEAAETFRVSSFLQS